MTQETEAEVATSARAAESETATTPKFAVAGGLLGTIIGSRRSKTAAVLGGIVGGAAGHLLGKRLRTQPPEPIGEEGETEPVVVTVGDDEDEEAAATAEDADETAEATNEDDESA